MVDAPAKSLSLPWFEFTCCVFSCEIHFASWTHPPNPFLGHGVSSQTVFFVMKIVKHDEHTRQIPFYPWDYALNFIRDGR